MTTEIPGFMMSFDEQHAVTLGGSAGNVKAMPSLLQNVPSLKHFKDALTMWAAGQSIELLTETVIPILLTRQTM